MKKNILISVLVITLIATIWVKIPEIGTKPVDSAITNETNFNYKQHSLFNVAGMLFRINHETGKAHYFNQGVWIPVQELEMLQKIAIERQKYQQQLQQQSQQQKLLDNFD